jgi:cyclopropane-fatty-acyl-phospholipid synthase
MTAPVDRKAVKRLESFRRLLAHIRELLSLDLGFVLWDGTSVPAGLSSKALAIVLADEGVVAAILRRPNADTFLNLWVTARIDIRNGTIFDFPARWPKIRNREIRKRLDKKLALATALKFLFVPRGGPWPLEAIRGHEARRDGSEQTNKENVHYHSTSPTHSTRSFSIPRWSTPALISRNGTTVWRLRSATSSTSSAASCA